MKEGFVSAILPLVKRLLPYVILALLALLAGLGALRLAGVAPFGEATLCWQDNGQQVASDFGYVRGVWEGRHALDWSYACGGSPRSSFHPTFNNLVSPLTWAVAAVPGISAVMGLSLLLLLQLALLPLGAFYYLRKTFPRLPASLGMALALAYAFGGFVLSKYTFLPFLNVAILFPWYVAALDSLLRRGRWVPYTLLLAFMLAAATYFAWMWLLFAAVYAAARTGWRWRSPVRQHTLCLFLASAGALLLSAFSWLPSFLVTAGSARAGESYFWWNATRVEAEPSALFQFLCLPAALCVLICLHAWRHLRCSRYALTLAVVAVGLTCVSATTLWQLSRPWDFAGRFGYMADFLFICLAAQVASDSRRRGSLRWFYVTLVGALALTALLCSWQNRYGQCYQSSADRVRIAEWAAHEIPYPAGRAKSHGFAAVENLAFFTPFDSLSHFTACITKEQEETLARWGYHQRAAVISTEGGTLASDSLLGMRYILSQDGEGAPFRVEENPYCFGMGVMVPAGLFPLRGEDPIARQQELLAALLGAECAGTRRVVRAGEPLELPSDCLHYLQQPEDGLAFVFSGQPYERWGGVEGAPRLWELPAGTYCVERWGGGAVELFHLPLAGLKELKRYALELPVFSEYSGRRMSIHCRSTQGRDMLFLPLLFQWGYEASVDGTPADVFDLDGFVGIPMRAPGEHCVELVYRAWGSWEGRLISLAALLLLPGAWLLSRCVRAPRCLNALCRCLLLGVSWLLLLWPLFTLPIGLLWR